MKISIKIQVVFLAGLLPFYVNSQINCDANANRAIQCSSDANDCSTILICLPGKADPPIATMKCQSEAPYCNKGAAFDSCLNSVDPNKKNCIAKSNMKCLQPGIFPDLNECSIYYVCVTDKLGEDAQSAPCFPGSIFHLGLQKCVAGTTCSKLTCSKEGFFPHPVNAEYYCACVKDQDKFKVSNIFKCAKGEKYSSTLACQYNCIRQGYFAHENKKMYYSCNLQGGAWKSSILECPDGLQFREDLNGCGGPDPLKVNVAKKSLFK